MSDPNDNGLILPFALQPDVSSAPLLVYDSAKKIYINAYSLYRLNIQSPFQNLPFFPNNFIQRLTTFPINASELYSNPLNSKSLFAPIQISYLFDLTASSLTLTLTYPDYSPPPSSGIKASSYRTEFLDSGGGVQEKGIDSNINYPIVNTTNELELVTTDTIGTNLVWQFWVYIPSDKDGPASARQIKFSQLFKFVNDKTVQYVYLICTSGTTSLNSGYEKIRYVLTNPSEFLKISDEYETVYEVISNLKSVIAVIVLDLNVNSLTTQGIIGSVRNT